MLCESSRFPGTDGSGVFKPASIDWLVQRRTCLCDGAVLSRMKEKRSWL